MNFQNKKEYIKIDPTNLSIKVINLKRYKNIFNVIFKLELLVSELFIDNCIENKNNNEIKHYDGRKKMSIISEWFSETFEKLSNVSEWIGICSYKGYIYIKKCQQYKDNIKILKNKLLQQDFSDIITTEDDDDHDFFDNSDDVEIEDQKCGVCYIKTFTVVKCCNKNICKCCLHNTVVTRQRQNQSDEMYFLCPLCRQNHYNIMNEDDENGPFWKIIQRPVS